MIGAAVGPVSNPFHINTFWVKTANGTIKAADVLGESEYIRLQKRSQKVQCACVHTSVSVSVYFTLCSPDLKVALAKNERFSSALLPQPKLKRKKLNKISEVTS